MKTEESPSGEKDDASVTQEVAGSKSANYGLAIDTIGRTTPTHMLPSHVRSVLAQYWNEDIPWYTPIELDATDGIFGSATSDLQLDSVSSMLYVNTDHAEEFGSASISTPPATGNSFLNYTDVPFNKQTLNRLAFWRYDKEAAELDPHFGFEGQVYAVDCMSQLFVESFDFHFHFLATLDEEYHRLRPSGPLGVLDESAEDTPWHHMYHYWRGRIEDTYLDSGQVTLPAGLQNANWTIQDVLDELLLRMVEADGRFRPDIFVTTKGALSAKSGSTLGVIEDASFVDNDGNPRWYMPAWRSLIAHGTGTAATPGMATVVQASIGHETTLATFSTGVYTSVGADPALDDGGLSLERETRSNFGTLSWLEEIDRAPAWYAGVTAGNIDAGQLDIDTGQPDLFLQSLPAGAGATGALVNGSLYWRGYHLNLFELTDVMRRIGRGLEPEVSEGFLPQFGLLDSPTQLAGTPLALASRTYDDLFNLYQASYTYRDNPIRTYSAGHLGPIDNVLAVGELTLEGVDLTTVDAVTGEEQTVRERFWTPEMLEDDAEVGEILNHFFPGSFLEGSMLGDITLSGNVDASALARHVNGDLVSRVLGNNNSMLTKIEKPVILPAGLAAADTAFASGIGVGSVELIMELVFSAIAGEPHFTLGHNGFVDWMISEVAEGNTNPEDPSYPEHYPSSRREEMAASEAPNYVMTAGPTAVPAITQTVLMNALSEASDELASISSTTAAGTSAADADAVSALISNMEPSLVPTGTSYYMTENTNFQFAGGGASAVASTQNEVAATLNVQTSPLDATAQWGYLAPGSVETDPGIVEGTGTSYTGLFAGTVNGILSNNWGYSIIPGDITLTKGSDSVVIDPGLWGYNVPSSSYFSLLEFQGIFGGEAKVEYTQGGSTASDGNVAIPIMLGTATDTSEVVKPCEFPLFGSVGKYVVPAGSPMDYILAAIQQAVNSDPVANGWLLEGTNSIDVEFDNHVWCAGWSAGVITSPVAPTTWQGHVMSQSKIYTVTWDGVRRTNLPFDVDVSAERTQFAGGSQTRTGDVWSDSRTTLTLEGYGVPWQGAALAEYIDVTKLTGPLSLHCPVEYAPQPGVPDSVDVGQVHSLIGRVSNTGLSPAGEWDGPIWSIDTTLDDTFFNAITTPGDFALAHSLCVNTAFSGVPGSGSRDWIDAQFQTPGANVDPGFFDIWSVSFPDAWQTDIYGAGSTPYCKSSWVGTATSGNSQITAYAGPSLDSVPYIIPDDPENRMIYRPYRRLVDAAVAREQKLLFMPTHENLEPTGGVFGLPVYGEPALFRLAQMHYGANRAQQYILEKSMGKTRMVDSANRGMLTFSKAPLLDPQSQRHILPDVVRGLNDLQYSRGNHYAASATGTKVYTRDLIREIQLGRQYQRMS